MQATINNEVIEFYEGETILQAARRVGIFIPTLCEFAALDHRPGTCRVCLVELMPRHENEKSKIVTSCNTLLEDGMVIRTRSRHVRAMQKLQVELLFADHHQDCASCDRHGDCELQKVANYVGLSNNRWDGKYEGKRPTDLSGAALTFTADRCIRCLRCVEVCRKVQGIGNLTLNEIGVNARVGYGDKRRWVDSDRCINCGQCTLVCPTGALAIKDQTERVIDWLEDPEVITVFQVAPATRLALAERLGFREGTNVEGQLVAALKDLGADYVMDTRFAADVTIMEEGHEVIERIEAKLRGEDVKVPVFTSCCPGWINYVEKTAPDMIPHISSTKSPQGIFGAIAKNWLPQKLSIPAEKMRVISLMPCSAKKDEASRKQLGRDVDLVLTVREVAHLLQRSGIDLKFVKPQPFDNGMSYSSGAGQLFATSGGVMEAALRTLYAIKNPVATEKRATLPGGDIEVINHDNPPQPRVIFQGVRGLSGVKEARVELGDLGRVRVAVVHGLHNIEPILRQVRNNTCPYHFIEVMSCPGGCVGGGGTSRGKKFWRVALESRQASVYALDDAMTLGRSDENPEVKAIYEEFLGQPNKGLAHEILHTHYEDRSKDLASHPTIGSLFRRLTLTE